MAKNLGLKVFNKNAPEEYSRGQFVLLAMKSTLDNILSTKGADDDVFLPW